MRRPFVIFLITLVVLGASVIALAVTLRDWTYDLRGYRDATASLDLPYWQPKLGVNASLGQYSSEALAQTLDQMRAAHITWVRQVFDWSQAETSPGVFDWSAFDAIIEPFRDADDLNLVAVLSGSPEWDRDPRADGSNAPPADPASFASFASAFAARYGDVVDVYQVWDEPNLADGWGGLNPSPADYAALLAAAYASIHGADADAQVLAAALAPTVEQGPRNISDIQFLRDLLAIGAGETMDGAAGKPYGFEAGPDDRTVSEDTLNFSRIIALREILEAAGYGTMPLWASNWGWNALPEGWTGEPSIWGQVTRQQQADYTLAAIDRADREWPWLSGLILQQWQPDAAGDDAQWGFALRGPDGAASLLAEALAARPDVLSAPDGLHFPQSPFAHYSGLWTFGELGADIGWLNDSQVEFDFTGRDIALALRQGDYVALLYPRVDDQPANQLPVDAQGNPYILLTSGSLAPEESLVAVSRGLAAGAHTLSLTTDRGWDQWALAGIAVSSGDLTAPYRQQASVAVVAIALSLASAVVAGWRVPWRRQFAWVGRGLRRIGLLGEFILSAIAALALMLGMLLSLGSGAPDVLRREPVPLALALATAGLTYVSPGLLLTLAALVALFVLLYHRPVHGVYLIIVFAPLFLFPVELYRFAFPMAELILLITVLAAALRTLVGWARDRQSAVLAYPAPGLSARLSMLSALDWCVAVYVGLGALAVTWSAVRGPALTEFRTLFVEQALFYLLFRAYARQPRHLTNAVLALMTAALIVCGVGLWQILTGQGVITAEGGVLRMASVYGSPNNAALFLERVLPFAFAFALMLRPARLRLLAAGFCVVAGVCILLTQSAGALFLGVPASLIVVLMLALGRRALAPIGAVIVLVLAALALAVSSERFSRLLTGEGTSFLRIRVWQSALQMLRDHPLTGIGLDQFLYLYRGAYVQPDAWQEPNLSHPHNLLLDSWLRLSVFGPIWALVTGVLFFRTGLRTHRRLRAISPASAAIVAGALGSMTALIVHGLVDNSIFVSDLALLLMLLLALVAQSSNIISIDDPERTVL